MANQGQHTLVINGINFGTFISLLTLIQVSHQRMLRLSPDLRPLPTSSPYPTVEIIDVGVPIQIPSQWTRTPTPIAAIAVTALSRTYMF